MDLANLKNIDLKEIIEKFKSEGLSDKKLLIKFGAGFFSILIFLIIYYAFVSTVVELQKEKIALMNENKNKMIEINNNTGALTAAIKKLEPEYNKNSKLFHSKKEVEDLYQNVSKFALLNGLSIINLKKGEIVPVNGSAPQQQSTTESLNQNSGNLATQNALENPQVAYYKIPVDYEIQGSFLGYLKFRRSLAESQKVINFDKEEINILKESQGQILSKGTISIVGLPNEYDE